MTNGNTSTIMAAYDAMTGAYADLSASVERLIRDFLISNEIQFVDVVSRVKERASLEGKISRKGEGRYKRLSDITDICGARVITYLEGDVRRVSEIIEHEFEIDRKNSIDKSTPVDPDRFGYRSVHYVVSHRRDRVKLSEYSRFANLKIEIQVRSILQHAWAEIEHDLGYKSAEDVPLLVKRRFSRLAGLLELADEEFMTIRDELAAYERELPERLADSSVDVPIDAESYVAFVNTDKVPRRIDSRIAGFVDSKLNDVAPQEIGERVAMMRYLGLATIGDIRKSLQENESLIVEVAERWLTRDAPGPVLENWAEMGLMRGIATFYLGYTLLLQSGNREYMDGYVGKFMHSDDLASRLLATFDDFPRNGKQHA
jgi:putative GTP pyrophosphokinase